tara:strand:+ start:462 stop:617 length:156 start_codon:yes stop_codon:yes gene_type:complete
MNNNTVHNEEGRLVACDEATILELLEENGYLINISEKEAKQLRIEHGVDDE